jgi:restriction system protein
MTVPDYQSLMLPVLRLAANGETKVSGCIDSLSQELGCLQRSGASCCVVASRQSFRTEFIGQRPILVKAGLLEITRRGHFRATRRGLTAISRNPQRIDNAFLSQFSEFQAFRARSVVTDAAGELATMSDTVPTIEKATPEERIEAAYEEVTAELSIVGANRRPETGVF